MITFGTVVAAMLAIFGIATVVGMVVRLAHGVRQRWRGRRTRGDGGERDDGGERG